MISAIIFDSAKKFCNDPLDSKKKELRIKESFDKNLPHSVVTASNIKNLKKKTIC